MKLGLKIRPGDEALHYLLEEGELQGLVLTHVDYMILAGSIAFIEKIRAGIADELTVSKVEKCNCQTRFWLSRRYLRCRIFCLWEKARTTWGRPEPTRSISTCQNVIFS